MYSISLTEIVKEPKDYSYNELFKNCTKIDYLTYLKAENPEMFLAVVN
jgi:hypothetical protein